MGRCRAVTLLILILLWVGCHHVHAVEIQFVLATNNVVGVSDLPIAPVDGRGVATINGVTEDSIVWPVPTGSPAVTSCDQGHPEWTHLTNPNGITIDELGLTIRTDLLFFHSSSPLLVGCYQVSSWHQLRALYRETIAVGVLGAEQDLIEAIDDVQMWVMRICPGTTGGANCTTARANMVTMDQDYRGSGQAATLTTQMVTVRNDVYAFKAAQGW